NAGFSLVRHNDGTLGLEISAGPNGPVRYSSTAPGVNLTNGVWYHVAVVGTGPGQPIKYYVTPVSSGAVQSIPSDILLSGNNGNYPTDFSNNLVIGGLFTIGLRGEITNESIFNQALTPAQIQALFLDGKGLMGV